MVVFYVDNGQNDQNTKKIPKRSLTVFVYFYLKKQPLIRFLKDCFVFSNFLTKRSKQFFNKMKTAHAGNLQIYLIILRK